MAAGSTITLTATVAGASKTIAPTGTVSFMGNQGGPTGNVSYTTVSDPNTGNLDLQASLTFAPNINESFGAQYSGDSNYPGQVGSNSVQITVIGSDFALFPGQSSLTVQAGNSAAGSVVLGFQSATGPVSFVSCSGLPSEASCSFSPNPATSAGYVGVTINTSGPHLMALHQTSFSRLRHLWLGASMPIFSILLISIPRRKIPYRVLLIVTTVLLLGSFGCGGGSSSGGGGGSGPSDPGTPRGNYSVTVSASSGSYSHTTSFTLIVQ